MGRSEREKMLAGEPYRGMDPELLRLRGRARELCAAYNATRQDEAERRAALLAELLAEAGPEVWIEPPFFCDYGSHLSIGAGVFINTGCVVLDCAPVRIGAGTQVGPAVQIYTATHPLDPAERRAGMEMARPVDIGENVWIGGAAIILPGVAIGSDTTIGAGSVVTRSVPAGVLAAGNPCRVIRELAWDGA